eukprot:CAMPEP_0201485014 /NCGR_PEP_ID=MMETSP0151_2-20130828/9149_1 /ASSEMBLY_ACC=CAM_ASM_000257 /TAXON_ID=200890 /ORGANISM="Paramoeba atlantica, Strain 621/1 / CCAP 1560/9" /LENGTH=419 /DNA_ID=CAMNT_0047868949 /DNA_START=115 /DNA_END=1374 /DNA_ORIENTATION=+
MASSSSKVFEVVVWGATGFTGNLVAKYLASASSRFPSLRWAIAGRNQQKLQLLKDSLSTSNEFPKILVGDSTNQASVDQVVQKAKVVIATAGPYYLYGFPIVDACVRFGSDYVDITGETPFVKRLIDQYDEEARSKGIHIVPMCGFDSIPSDFGAYLCAKELRSRFGQECRKVKGYATINGTFSGGTVSTGMVMQSKPELREQLMNPFLLGGETKAGIRKEDVDIRSPKYDEEVGSWTGPFMMGAINTRVVRRSHSLFRSSPPSTSPFVRDIGYGENFGYNEVAIARDERMAKAMAHLMRVSVEQKKKQIEEGSLPKPGEGPSEEQRKKSNFEFRFLGESEEGRKVNVVIRGGDPGYTETSKMVAEAGLCLAARKSDVLQQCKGGVVTPAFAFGDLLINALSENGMQFVVNREGSKANL